MLPDAVVLVSSVGSFNSFGAEVAKTRCNGLSAEVDYS